MRNAGDFAVISVVLHGHGANKCPATPATESQLYGGGHTAPTTGLAAPIIIQRYFLEQHWSLMLHVHNVRDN